MKIQPQGNIIATGEDGVPWELYENGYLLFKPEINKDTLTNQYPAPSWKEKYGEKIVAIGFTNEVYAPEDSSVLFCKNNQCLKENLVNLIYIEAHKINTSKVTNMYCMFHLSKVESLDLSNWDTSKVTNMLYMLNSTNNLQYLNIANWYIKNLHKMRYMFYDNNNLKFIDCSHIKHPSTHIKNFFEEQIHENIIFMSRVHNQSVRLFFL